MQVAFLAAMVGPKVAAAAAQRALEVLGEEDPAVAAEAAALKQDATTTPNDRSESPGMHTHRQSCNSALLHAVESALIPPDAHFTSTHHSMCMPLRLHAMQ